MTRCTVALTIARVLMAAGHRPYQWLSDNSEIDFLLSVVDAERYIPPAIEEDDMRLTPDDDWNP